MVDTDFERWVLARGATSAHRREATGALPLLLSAALAFAGLCGCGSEASPVSQAPTGATTTVPVVPSTASAVPTTSVVAMNPPVSSGTASGAVAGTNAQPSPVATSNAAPMPVGPIPALSGMAGAMAMAPVVGGAGDMTNGADPARTLPPVTSLEMDGPFKVTVDQQGGASSWVFRPTELGKDGAKHPVFVFGNGATATPMSYVKEMSRVASHGIIVVDPSSSMVTADNLKAALDWISGENEKMGSIYYHKLNGKYAMGGHSLGSLSTFDAEKMEMRVTTTLHIAGGSFDMMGSSKVKTPTAYICGDTDFARPNCEADFANVGKQPTFFTTMTGSDHILAVTNGLPAIIGWLRYQLAGEAERRAMFTGPDGEFFKGKWMSQTKNWN